MLIDIPQTLLILLTARINEGVERGRICIDSLSELVAIHGSAQGNGQDNLSWAERALPWARKALECVPAHINAVGITRSRHAGPWSFDGTLPQAMTLEASCGLPDVMTLAIAMALLAHHGAWRAKVVVHPDLTTAACQKQGKARGRALLGVLAEMGLAGRPWHLWVGPPSPIELLSPYVRDLGEALWAWGQRQGLVPPDIHWAADSNLPEQYALAEAFVGAQPDVARERAAAERTAGVTRAKINGLNVCIVDLGRSDASVRDPRLADRSFAPTAAGSAPPLLLQIPHSNEVHDERALASLVSRLCQSIGSQALSITVCQAGVVRDPEVRHVHGTSLLRIAGQWSLSAATSQHPAPSGCIDALPWATEALQPGPKGNGDIFWTDSDDAESGPAQPAARVGGDAIVWGALLRLWHRGALGPAASLTHHVYRDGDMAASDNIALVTLGSLMEMEPHPTPENRPQSANAHRLRV